MNARQFNQAIYKWVADNYGKSEADSPSWDIKALSNHLAIKQRLEDIRQSLHAENLSYGEILELQILTEYIDDGDNELLEAAGVVESEVK